MDENDDLTIERDGAEEDGVSETELEEQESRADTKLSKLRKELEQCRKERQEHLDGWQRAKADYVNALKRFEEERTEAIKLGAVSASRAFITAMDSLERAEAAGEVPAAFQAIAKQLHEATGALGLVQFGTVGERFDPMLHEALGQDAVDTEEQDDVITAVLETGWKSGEHVVRPAKVRVGSFGQ